MSSARFVDPEIAAIAAAALRRSTVAAAAVTLVTGGGIGGLGPGGPGGVGLGLGVPGVAVPGVVGIPLAGVVVAADMNDDNGAIALADLREGGGRGTQPKAATTATSSTSRHAPHLLHGGADPVVFAIATEALRRVANAVVVTKTNKHERDFTSSLLPLPPISSPLSLSATVSDPAAYIPAPPPRYSSPTSSFAPYATARTAPPQAQAQQPPTR